MPFKAQPLPNFGKVFKPEHKPQLTEVKEFSFATSDKERFHKKEEKIQMIIEEEKKVSRCVWVLWWYSVMSW